MEKKFFKGGAPEKPEDKKRARFVQVRFTHDEFKAMEERRSKTMARDISTFVRSVCLEKPLLLKTQMESYQEVALSLLREMRSDMLRIGVNINQSSRRINSTTNYHDLQWDVNQMSESMGHIDAQIRQLIVTIAGYQLTTDSTYDHQDK